MRPILFYFWFEHPWAGWTTGMSEYPLLGACWALLIAAAGYLLFHRIRGDKSVYADPATYYFLGGGLLLFSFGWKLGLLPPLWPLYGYGLMVLIGVAGAIVFTYARARAVGVNPEQVIDSSFWMVVAGVSGGRLAYLVQYRHEVFPPGQSLAQALFAAVNLTQGGLVLLGALVGGGLGFLAYCLKHKVRVREYGDLVIPAIFIGVGFGRIGCLLNGCCFGDRCDLPWAIQFPHNSITWAVLAERGFLSMDDQWTMPLHPTFYWYRRYPGDVLALGCILYPITRFLIEFLRADEMGQLGTGLTISQIYCLGIAAFGVALMATNPYWARRHPAPAAVSPTAA